jgi:hypothetical protein
MSMADRSRDGPPIHLWTYNHSPYRISDQVDYFTRAFRQHGYQTSVGRSPSDSALNVVIENFSERTRKTLIDFCTRTRKRVAVIMTEHIDFLDRRILIHGEPLWNANDYMQPATQVERLQCLMSCRPYIRFFMVLGDLPELRNFGDMMPGVDLRAVAFPRLDRAVHDGNGPGRPKHDLLFTGAATEYRERLLQSARSLGLSVDSPRGFASPEKRDCLNQSARIVLNIPQRESWRWLSLMRVIAALRCGRATVSLGTGDTSAIAACTYQLDLLDTDWRDRLKAYVGDYDTAYDRAYEGYCRLAADFEAQNPFPHDLIETWAITDRVHATQRF